MLHLSLWAKVILGAVALAIVLFKLVDWTAEYLWFQALGYESVFWTLRELKVGFFLLAFIPALAYFWVNARFFAARSDLSALASALATQLAGQSAAPRAPPVPSGTRPHASDASRVGTPVPIWS